MRWMMLLLMYVTLLVGTNAGCDDTDGDGDADTDSDGDGDADGDGDVDGDGDSDVDVDGDVDGDSDVDVDGDSDVDVDGDADGDADGDMDGDADGDADTDEDEDSDGRCSSDRDCPAGVEWCEGGRCVTCDNGGLTCRIACHEGWNVYIRNGCHPCACAPANECTADGDCPGSGGTAGHCYPGAMCWDWCPAGDPSCCFGNLCSLAGCADPHPQGCWSRGCPIGQECADEGCASSGCGCSESSWVCDADCGGGTCRPGAAGS